VFLRLKGVDPDKHPVMKELVHSIPSDPPHILTTFRRTGSRHTTSKSGTQKTLQNVCLNPPLNQHLTFLIPTGTTKIDVAAAGRFINAAIPRAQRLAAEAADPSTTDAESSRASTPAPAEEQASEVGRSSRFKMAHDATSEKLADAVQAEEMRIVDAAVETEAVSTPARAKDMVLFFGDSRRQSGKESESQPRISWMRTRRRKERPRARRKRHGRVRVSGRPRGACHVDLVRPGLLYTCCRDVAFICFEAFSSSAAVELARHCVDPLNKSVKFVLRRSSGCITALA
jgi:hypothetical protein